MFLARSKIIYGQEPIQSAPDMSFLLWVIPVQGLLSAK